LQGPLDVRRCSGIGAVAGGAWVAFQGLSALRHAGPGLPASSLAAAGAVTAGLALAAAVRTACWAWRGPLVVSLPSHDVAMCGPAEAEAVRGAAQLRGTLGGAGHVHRARLALPAAAWAAAAAAAIAGPEVHDVAPWVTLVGALATAALLFPAKAFFYREATAGRVVVHPASARQDLVRSRGVRAALPGDPGTP
jgi:hypothetical protein